MRKQYLKEHRRGFYAALLLRGKLIAHLNEPDALVREFIFRTVKNMTKRQGVDETLKARDQMAWVIAMNTIKAQAEETALAEFVYSVRNQYPHEQHLPQYCHASLWQSQ